MKKQPSKIKLGLFIFLLGFIGVLTILTMELPLPEYIKDEIYKIFTPFQFKLLSLINPTILLVIATTVGTFLYDKLHFKLPILENWIWKLNSKIEYQNILKFGVLGGIISGVLILLFSLAYISHIPKELSEIETPVLARFLYGGITEEILLRFGFMTFIVWILHKILNTNKSGIYWTGIIISSVLFGIGHLPIVFMSVENPGINLIMYIILGNSIGGVVFGWLYWKKGLETAMIAHIFTHIVFLILGNL